MEQKTLCTTFHAGSSAYERRRIARELHDATGQALAVMMSLQMITEEESSLSANARKALQQSLSISKQSSKACAS